MKKEFNRIQALLKITALIAAVALAAGYSRAAGTVQPEEMQKRKEWVGQRLSNPRLQQPFSFVYGGQPSAELLKSWPMKKETKTLDDARTQHTYTWNDPKTGLEVRCAAVEYSDFPVVEWTVYFKNAGKENTPILENIQGLDTRFQRPDGGEFVLHGNKGDVTSPESYEPYDLALSPNARQQFVPTGGRSTGGTQGWPYYNIQMPGGGFILAVGWPGQWASSFVRDETNGLHIKAGQELTHLSLKPGEQIRSPLIAILFWQGTNAVRSQNVWRRWMLAHNLPRPYGKPLRPMFFGCCTGIFEPTYRTTEANERQFIETFVKEGIKFDYWWVDAGWFRCDDFWWNDVGNWVHDERRFPNGLKVISDLAHANGAKFILWFEAERAGKASPVAKEHPEWLHDGLLNLGDPEAWNWLVNRVDKSMKDYGVDLYRQDFNFDPLPVWRKMDAPDRQGMAENLYVQGYLSYWDELRRRHPGLQIDCCCSGGRRIDLETLRRSPGPHTRSDYIAFDGSIGTAVGNQGQTYGLSQWLPYYGQGVYYKGQPTQDRIYNVRSYMGAAFGICVDVRRPDVDWDLYRRLVSQWRQVADCFLGDYYPLTPRNLAEDCWIAWQFDRPEQGDGMIQAFRHGACEQPSMTFRLGGLDADAQYEVTDLDAGTPAKTSGKKLMEKGLTIEIKDKPGAAVIAYKRVK